MTGALDHPGCEAFFTALLEGRLKLGQTVTQEELGRVLGLSLSRMREVTTLLEAEGLVDVRKRRGLTIFYPDVAFVGSTYQFREILECEGLRRFSETVTPEWLSAQTEAHAEILDFVRSNPHSEVYAQPVKQLERGFHDSFIDVFANAHLADYFHRNAQKAYLLRLINPDAVGLSGTILSLNEHRDVIESLRKGDADEAVAALKRHLSNVLHRVLTH